jgi:hypothetical protein
MAGRLMSPFESHHGRVGRSSGLRMCYFRCMMKALIRALIAASGLLPLLAGAQGDTDAPKLEGHLRLTDHCSVDLDLGQSECMVILDGDGTESPGYPPNKKADFRVELDGAQMYFRPVHGAEISRCGGTGLNTATGAKYARRRLRVDDLPSGSHICIRTNEGRYGQLTINKLTKPPLDSIELTYLVW